MTFEEVVASLRAHLAERAGADRAVADRIAAALAAYVRAHEVVLANAFAERNGLAPVEGSSDVVAAALDLRDLVARLHGLGAPAPAAATAPAASTAPAEVRSTREALDEAERSLDRDFQAAGFASMSVDEFLLHADEFAARARALQERTGGDRVSQRVIRALTALVRERQPPRKVFGLSHAHRGDWSKLADEARRRRLASVRPPGSASDERIA